MACELSIDRRGKHLVKPASISLTRPDNIKALFARLDQEYPEELGFEIVISRSNGAMPTITRSEFRKACQSENWRDLINCFIDEEEYQLFCKAVYFMDLDEAYYHIDDLDKHQGLTRVRCYPCNMVVFELDRERHTYQIFGHSDFESEDLQAVERELYRVFLHTFDSLYLENLSTNK